MALIYHSMQSVQAATILVFLPLVLIGLQVHPRVPFPAIAIGLSAIIPLPSIPIINRTSGCCRQSIQLYSSHQQCDSPGSRRLMVCNAVHALRYHESQHQQTRQCVGMPVASHIRIVVAYASIAWMFTYSDVVPESGHIPLFFPFQQGAHAAPGPEAR